MFLPSGETGFQLTGITSQTCGIPYPPKAYSGETCDIGISLQAEHRDIDSTSDCASDDSSDVAITEAFPVVESSSPKPKEKTDEQSSPTVENINFFTEGLDSASHVLPDEPAAEASQDHDMMMQVGNEVLPDESDAGESQNHDTVQVSNESGVLIPSLEYPDMLVPQDSVVEDNVIGSHDGVQVIEDGLVVPGSPGEQPAKKPRLTPSSEVVCDGVQMDDNGLVIPDSPGQQPAEELRPPPSMEVETDVVESLDEDSRL